MGHFRTRQHAQLALARAKGEARQQLLVTRCWMIAGQSGDHHPMDASSVDEMKTHGRTPLDRDENH
jgi:hypothetical protein